MVKDALIPDPSLEVADRFRGAVLLLTIGHRFSKLKRLIFWVSGGGGTNLSQGDQAKVPALHYQVLLLEISTMERDIVKSFLKEKYMLKVALYHLLIVYREMI